MGSETKTLEQWRPAQAFIDRALEIARECGRSIEYRIRELLNTCVLTGEVLAKYEAKELAFPNGQERHQFVAAHRHAMETLEKFIATGTLE